MKISCVIVEDEPLALDKVKDYVQRLPFLKLLATFDSAIEAMEYIQANQIDILFLDIHLGDFSGIQLLQTSTIKCQVILTTAYHEYALQGFDLKVADYLLKPYTFERFVQAVDRVQALLPKSEAALPKTYIFVKTEYRLEKIVLDEILFIEGMGDYRRIHTLHKKIMTLQTFNEFEQQLLPSMMCRVHKSYMVAVSKIDSIEKDRIRIKDTLIPISESYKHAFFSLIQTH
ncbi:MAG: LytTR family DNA-binding domain-containing protein [Spirosomataceae bacterium]